MASKEIEIAFVDLNLGEESGFDFARQIRQEGRPIKIFIITSSSKEEDFERAKNLGVDAYLLKDAFIDEIMFGLKVVERGGRFYSMELLEKQFRYSKEEQLLEQLTLRELEVLLELSKGSSNANIGLALYISEGTVKKHISSILAKLTLKNRMEAMLFANRNNVVLETVLMRSRDAQKA